MQVVASCLRHTHSCTHPIDKFQENCVLLEHYLVYLSHSSRFELALLHCRFLLPVLTYAAGVASLSGQGPAPLPGISGCNPIELRTDANLNFEQRGCWFLDRLLSPSGIVHGAFSSTFSQWRNVPFERHEDIDDFGHRFAVFYARRAAQNTGEFLAGYLNRENPRPHLSTENGFWKRTRSALFSVVAVEGADGGNRPALAPIAGAFGSGFVGVACYRTHNTLEDGFRRTGLAYGGYFGSALAHEFHPDIAAIASRLLHQKRTGP